MPAVRSVDRAACAYWGFRDVLWYFLVSLASVMLCSDNHMTLLPPHRKSGGGNKKKKKFSWDKITNLLKECEKIRNN